MIDIVIPLGKGSHWQNNELRYALRGVEMWLRNVGEVIIVGELPEWCINVVHLKYAEANTGSRALNIALKTLYACDCEAVSDDFIFMSDDHFIKQEFDATCFPVFHQGDLKKEIQRRPKNDDYRKVIQQTYDELRVQQFTTLNYNLHLPMLLNKNQVQHLINSFDWNCKYGYALKSLYGNAFACGGAEIADVKLRKHQKENAIRAEIDRLPFFSIGDLSLNLDMKRVLSELFPDKSKYEV